MSFRGLARAGEGWRGPARAGEGWRGPERGQIGFSEASAKTDGRAMTAVRSVHRVAVTRVEVY